MEKGGFLKKYKRGKKKRKQRNNLGSLGRFQRRMSLSDWWEERTLGAKISDKISGVDNP
jgi:hypothetical protein